MQTLSDLCVAKLAGNKKVRETQVYQDSEIKYIKNLGEKLHRKKEIYLFNLCRWYLIEYLTPDEVKGFDCQVYHSVDLEKLEHWQRAMWAACEVCFGEYHSAQDCVERIRQELQFEHARKRYLNFKLEDFEKTLSEKCPNMKGNVRDWYQVFLKSPPRFLLYGDFFG
jgi:hypothetical protein